MGEKGVKDNLKIGLSPWRMELPLTEIRKTVWGVVGDLLLKERLAVQS